MPRVTPATEQQAQFETRRKIEMLVEWLEHQAQIRTHAKVFGRTNIEVIWEGGCARRVKLVDEVVIEDLTEKERELVMRSVASADGKRAA